MGKKTIAKEGRSVKVHSKGTLDDGKEFDNSYKRGEAIGFTVGAGEMIPGFDSAVAGMKVGQKKTIKVPTESAYGVRNPNAVQEVPKTLFPVDFPFQPGVMVEGNNNGHPVRGVINDVAEEMVLVDFNHPLSGMDLNFDIELVEVD